MYLIDLIAKRKLVTPTQADDIAQSDYYTDLSADQLPEYIFMYDDFWLIEKHRNDPRYHVTIHNYTGAFPTLLQAELQMFLMLQGGQITRNVFIDDSAHATHDSVAIQVTGVTAIDCRGDLLKVDRSEAFAMIETCIINDWQVCKHTELGLTGSLVTANAEACIQVYEKQKERKRAKPSYELVRQALIWNDSHTCTELVQNTDLQLLEQYGSDRDLTMCQSADEIIKAMHETYNL